ncbi:hypothetical protein [Paraflavitalea pollutisoli]|uniref:hypothetical protein n=1 Tax=Paraflavitalea pollutisoli TaxID=3034143 RepID=UPI0023ED55E9|nr:hypothetical protein [Paraflavitalea sp. H1-2-19X]
MKKIFLIALLFVTLGTMAQTTINNYKVVLVPSKFEFLKDADQYSMNSLTKTLLEQKGFTVYIDGSDVPADIAADKCQALKADVTLRKGFLATNLTLTLKDCQGAVLYKSREGKSREKEWAVAYQDALRDAFKSFDTTQYAYNGNTPTRAVPAAAATVTPVTTTPALPAVTPAVAAAVTSDAGTLYAQATATGFQLIDTKPAKVMTLFKTSAPDTFLGEKGTIHGIVFKKGADWTFEYYQDGTLVAEKLVIKF